MLCWSSSALRQLGLEHHGGRTVEGYARVARNGQLPIYERIDVCDAGHRLKAFSAKDPLSRWAELLGTNFSKPCIPAVPGNRGSSQQCVSPRLFSTKGKEAFDVL